MGKREDRQKAIATLEQQLQDKLAPSGLELWKEICKTYGVDYNITKDAHEEWIAAPTAEYEARMKQFGSAIAQKKAEFWFEKAQAEWYQKFIVEFKKGNIKV